MKASAMFSLVSQEEHSPPCTARCLHNLLQGVNENCGVVPNHFSVQRSTGYPEAQDHATSPSNS